MGYYDENGLWIEDGTTYIFKPESSSDDLDTEQSKTAERVEDNPDESSDGEEVEQQVLMADGEIVN